MPDHARVVVIGGGAVGTSCLYHLAQLGWTDAILIEQNELTSGSTWHAAGNVPTFSTSWTLLKLQKYSADLYRRLAAEIGVPVTYHVAGSLRLAHSAERMDEFRHVCAMAQANGMEYELLPPARIRDRYPFVELDDLRGALWDPYDGDIDPAQLTQAFATGARAKGARIRRFEKVLALHQQPGGEWRITTDKGEIIAAVIVNAAGYRAGEVMALLGRDLPATVMSHQYLVTEEIPELAARAGHLPLLRDPDVSYYLRQEQAGLLLGPYEFQARPMWTDGLPEDFAFQLWDDDLVPLEPYIEAAMARVPLLASVGVRRVINGPIPYSPDGNPYIGPEHGLRNFFHCNTFTFGITQAGGAGRLLADWVVTGRPEWDLWTLDRRRYTDYADRSYAVAKAVETYQKEYAPAFPFEERTAGRPLRRSPIHDRLAAKGARFGARGGWERAIWFDADGSAEPDTLSFRRSRNWMPAVAAEVAAVRERAGIADFSGLTRFGVSGPGAEAWLNHLLCSQLPRPGEVRTAYALTPEGRILSEFSVARFASGEFQLISSAEAAWHDEDVLRAALPQDGSVRLTNMTTMLQTLLVAGPRAREVLSGVTEADLSEAAFPPMSVRPIPLGPAEVMAMRITSMGGPGWELHMTADAMPATYDALCRAGEAVGLRDFGLYAMQSLRLDTCCPAWKLDFDTTRTPLEAALGGFVDFTKPGFTGRDALLQQRTEGVRHAFVALALNDAGDADALPGAPVLHRGEIAGLVTSGGWSHRLNASIALAYIRSELAKTGTPLSINILGEHRAATVRQAPGSGPGNAHLRGENSAPQPG